MPSELAGRIGEYFLQLGPGARVSSAVLSRILQIHDTPGCPNTRELIGETVRRLGIPIGADARGYFLLGDEQDLETYRADLRGRAAAILAREKAVTEAWKRHYRDARIVPLEAFT